MRDSDEERADEEALIVRYAAGDREAARLLVNRLAPRAARYAARILGGDMAEGEDVAQEALIRLWHAAPGWRAGEARVTTWLYRVVTNLAIDRLRARARRPVTALLDAGSAAGDEPADGAPLPEARLIAAERLAALSRALAVLPERQRIAVVLRHIEGMGNPEIAAVLGTGVEAVESLTARGRRALRQELVERGETAERAGAAGREPDRGVRPEPGRRMEGQV